MSIKKIPENIVYTTSESEFIKQRVNISRSRWAETNNQNKLLKKKIKRYLIQAHKNSIINFNDNYIECAYCGCWLGSAGRGEIEHIAHKAKYMVFEYCETNLAFVCSHCNGSSKKHQKNIVTNWDSVSVSVNIRHSNLLEHIKQVYTQLIFSIVHPKLDDPDDHFEWTNYEKNILCGYKDDKGKNSIKMFELDNHIMTEQRIMQNEREKAYLDDPVSFKKAVDSIKPIPT